MEGLGVPSEKDVQRISQLRPRTLLYMFSSGKDSSLALLLTRDFMKDYCEKSGCKEARGGARASPETRVFCI